MVGRVRKRQTLRLKDTWYKNVNNDKDCQTKEIVGEDNNEDFQPEGSKSEEQDEITWRNNFGEIEYQVN